MALRAARSSRSNETGTRRVRAARAADVDLELALAPDAERASCLLGHARTLTARGARIGRDDSSSVRYPASKRLLDKSVVGRAARPALAGLRGRPRGDGARHALRAPRDRGPWLYRERRISRGREFDLLKFRTLRASALVARRRRRGACAHARGGLRRTSPGRDVASSSPGTSTSSRSSATSSGAT